MTDQRWTLTVRNGPHVARMRFQTLDGALDAMEDQLEELEPQAKREAVEVYTRRFDAARQVAVRVEVSSSGDGLLGGGARGGVDLRGDGSTEAYTGRIRRSLVALEPGESACDGLRRVLHARQNS